MSLLSEGSLFFVNLIPELLLFSGTFADALKKLVDTFTKVSWPTVLTHLFASLFVIAAVMWWFWTPTQKFIYKHKERLNKTYRDLVVANRESTRYLKLLKKENKDIMTIKAQTIAKVNQDAAAFMENARKNAINEADGILQHAKEKSNVMEENAKKLIKNSVVNLAIDLTKKLVADNINQKSSEKIIDNYIREIETKSLEDASK